MESGSSCNSFHPVPPFSINILRPAGDKGPVPPLDSLLPGVYRDESLPNLAVPSLTSHYLAAELGLGRLDGFTHHWFWLLGSPALPRPLTDAAHRGRCICVTERMDRHMGLGLGVGSKGGGAKRDLLYLKPLPRVLLDTRFWQDVLSCECPRQEKPNGNKEKYLLRHSPNASLRSHKTSSTSSSQRACNKRHLWECALGFLYSYAALVAHESDFHIAQKYHLLPAEVTWESWKALTRQVALSPDVVAHRFHQRYLYGELRLHRLREISQLKRGGLIPVLVGRLDRFARFFQNNVRWLASFVAYIAIVLSAIQAGLGTDRLSDSSAFQAFASGFTVFALVGPLSILLAFAFYFSSSLLYHVAVHVVTSHLFGGRKGQAILEGIDVFGHWDSKSEV